jgi:Flp pilus assembly protein TadG
MFLSVVLRVRKILGVRGTNKQATLGSDQRGVAAIEFALFGGLLSLAMLNVTDISVYLYQRMQVEYATEMGAQAALGACGSALPATTKCSGLTDAVQNAVASTSLGTRVSLQSGSPSEGYYCVNSSNALQYVSDVSSSKPASCSAAGTPGLLPGDYIQVQTTFSYVPLFPGITVTGTFTTPITRTAWMRLG